MPVLRFVPVAHARFHPVRSTHTHIQTPTPTHPPTHPTHTHTHAGELDGKNVCAIMPPHEAKRHPAILRRYIDSGDKALPYFK